MKNIITGIALVTVLLSSCDSGNKSNKNNAVKTDATIAKSQINNVLLASPAKASMNGIVAAYLHLKNALTNDNGNDAAKAGSEMLATLNKVDKSSFTPEQQKTYADLESDIRENAEHISKNSDRIAHQREHFQMLSEDIHDLVKTFGASQVLYVDFCPDYNNGKGGSWLSETKEINNPYFGKQMQTCGSVKEVIK